MSDLEDFKRILAAQNKRQARRLEKAPSPVGWTPLEVKQSADKDGDTCLLVDDIGMYFDTRGRFLGFVNFQE